MPLELTYRADTTVPVEVEGLTPDVFQGASLDEIRCFKVFHGNCPTPLGDLFDVAGDSADMVWHVRGELSGVHWLGAHQKAGEIHVHGPVGRHLGSQMQGGAIRVEGNSGDWLGAEMRGGLIHVRGDAGDLVGAAYRGSPRGMTGGAILVYGSAGSEIGHTMRRGMIAVGGTCGDLPGYAMLAGSLFVFGKCGSRPGAGMRRGTLGLFGRPHAHLLPTFHFACRYRPQVLLLLAERLRAQGFPFDLQALASPVDLFQGDFLEGGRGEVWMPVR
jgi:formylmethanofuran dehydrogenase subunit C